MTVARIFRLFFNLPIISFTKIFLINKVSGKENFPRRNFILASNHLSYLDTLVNGTICFPRSFRFIGQVDGWQRLKGSLIKLFYYLEGVIPLDRKNQESRRAAVEKAINSLKRGDILIIYPEGTRTRTNQIQKGKTGVAKVFLKTGLPIVPVGIKKRKLFEVNVGKPILITDDLERTGKLEENSVEYSRLLEKITAQIMEEISILAK